MGLLLLAPFFLLRFGLLACLSKEALARAARFAPLQGGEKAAYWLYQLSNVAIVVGLCFCGVRTAPAGWFALGLAVYGTGLVLLGVSVVNFAAPVENGFHQNGLYQLSRNPMYVSYFVFFLGCVLLTQSLVLLVFVLLFQLTAHWIIRSEERWCAEAFGEAYRLYRARVRRYF